MQHTTTTRANRIPRVAPAKPGLYRRLHIRIEQMVLLRRLDKLGRQADDIEKKLQADLDQAHKLSKLFRSSPLIEARRRTQRRELDKVIKDVTQVRQQLDNLAAELS